MAEAALGNAAVGTPMTGECGGTQRVCKWEFRSHSPLPGPVRKGSAMAAADAA